MEAERAIRILLRRVQLHANQAEHVHAGKNPRFQGRAAALRLVEKWIKELCDDTELDTETNNQQPHND